MENVYTSIKAEDQYEEVMGKIKGMKPDKVKEFILKEKCKFHNPINSLIENYPKVEPTKNNIRVRLPEKDDDDLSDVDVDAEAEAEINERMKIKVEAQLRYDRMAKNKLRKMKSTNPKKKF